MTSVTFDVPIINDIIHEGNESFTLTIVNSSLPHRVSRGDSHITTVTIVDTTGELIDDIRNCDIVSMFTVDYLFFSFYCEFQSFNIQC